MQREVARTTNFLMSKFLYLTQLDMYVRCVKYPSQICNDTTSLLRTAFVVRANKKAPNRRQQTAATGSHGRHASVNI